MIATEQRTERVEWIAREQAKHILRCLCLVLLVALAGCSAESGTSSEPSQKRNVSMSSSEPILDRLPADLAYLAAPARQYGVYQFDAEVDRLLESADNATRASLAALAERIRTSEHAEPAMRFIDKYSMTEFEESARLYFLLCLLDTAGYPVANPRPDTVAQYMDDLQQHGSYRLASLRMFAAMSLADVGKEAEPAIPLLTKSLSDDDKRVRIWSHCALARITGSRKEHEQAIRQILESHKTNEDDPYDNVRMEAESALERLNETK